MPRRVNVLREAVGGVPLRVKVLREAAAAAKLELHARVHPLGEVQTVARVLALLKTQARH